jgi:hypothetical protein
MKRSQSSTRAQAEGKGGGAHILRGRFKLRMLLGAGGVGLLACVACYTLPILGAIGVGSGAMAFFGILEPLSVGLVALGAISAIVTFVQLRRKGCNGPARRGASSSNETSCGCGHAYYRLSGVAER